MIGDTNMFVNNTVSEVDYFADINLKELLEYFDDELDDAGVTIGEVVDDTLTLIRFDDIQNITQFVLDISKDFMENEKNEAINLLSNLGNDTSKLIDELTDIQRGLAGIKNDDNCDNTCKTAMDVVGPITSSILDDLKGYTIIEDAKSSIEGINIDVEDIETLVNLINTADEALRNFSVAFVNDYTKIISDNVHNITDDIKNQVDSLTSELRNIDLNNTKPIQDIEARLDQLSEYTDVVLYVTLVPAIVLGIALLLSCFGLIIGKKIVINWQGANLVLIFNICIILIPI